MVCIVWMRNVHWHSLLTRQLRLRMQNYLHLLFIRYCILQGWITTIAHKPTHQISPVSFPFVFRTYQTTAPSISTLIFSFR